MKTSNENLKISFYLKKNIVRNGVCPVMGRIAIGQDKVQFSCKLEANPELWDTRAGRVNGKSHHAREVNREIDKINVAINAKYKEIVAIRGNATVEEVKNAFQGIISSQEMLLSIFREHNDEYKKRIGVTTARSTWQNYDFSFKHLEQFIQEKYNVSDVAFRQLDYSFIENFAYFLRIDCKLNANTSLHKLWCLRKMVKIAIGRGIISRDPFSGYSPERPKTTPKYIPRNELNKLMTKTLEKPSLRVTRDMFVFSCYTGLAYIDMYNLTNQQIVKNEDGSLWLNITRQKTGSDAIIPILDEALNIVEKYKGTALGDKVFPMKSKCLISTHLKEIARICNVERNLTFHMARHTFATEICLTQGVPIETVSRMLGHKDLIVTQVYAIVTHSKIEEDMIALSKKINGKYTLVS